MRTWFNCSSSVASTRSVLSEAPSKLYGFHRPIHATSRGSRSFESPGSPHRRDLQPLRDDLSALGVTACELSTMKQCPCTDDVDRLLRACSAGSSSPSAWPSDHVDPAQARRRSADPRCTRARRTMCPLLDRSRARAGFSSASLLDRRAVRESRSRRGWRARSVRPRSGKWFGSFRDISAAKAS